jgi:hypothetical protein
MIACARPTGRGSANARPGDAAERPERRPLGIGRQAGVAMLAISLLCGGCNSVSLSGSKKSGGLEQLRPRGVTFLEEVAVPEGFTYVSDNSWDTSSGGQRMARHEYRGGADPFAVREFYRQQMPQMGWERVSDQADKGVIYIRFEKRHEVCTVRIRHGDLERTVINVEVVPFNRTSVEPPKKRS